MLAGAAWGRRADPAAGGRRAPLSACVDRLWAEHLAPLLGRLGGAAAAATDASEAAAGVEEGGGGGGALDDVLRSPELAGFLGPRIPALLALFARYARPPAPPLVRLGAEEERPPAAVPPRAARSVSFYGLPKPGGDAAGRGSRDAGDGSSSARSSPPDEGRGGAPVARHLSARDLAAAEASEPPRQSKSQQQRRGLPGRGGVAAARASARSLVAAATAPSVAPAPAGSGPAPPRWGAGGGASAARSSSATAAPSAAAAAGAKEKALRGEAASLHGATALFSVLEDDAEQQQQQQQGDGGGCGLEDGELPSHASFSALPLQHPPPQPHLRRGPASLSLPADAVVVVAASGSDGGQGAGNVSSPPEPWRHSHAALHAPLGADARLVSLVLAAEPLRTEPGAYLLRVRGAWGG